MRRRLSAECGDSVLPQRSVCEWIDMLRNGRLSGTDEEESVCPSTLTTEGNIEQVRPLILDNRTVIIQCVRCRSYTQLSLPCSRQELNESPPSAGNNCPLNYSHNSAALSNIVWSVVCVDMALYTVEQRAFCMNRMWNMIPLEKCQRKFRRKFPRITVSSTTGFHKLVEKVRRAESLTDKKPAWRTPCACGRKPRRNKG
jgi:hypothetical protein